MAQDFGDLPPARRPAADSQQGVGGQSRRILIIEDNLDAAQTLCDLLELNGHEVRVAYNGTEGVEEAARFQPNIILCDIGLPGISGWEVARILRELKSTATSRLIAISGYGTTEDRRLSAEAGFEAHLTKPVDVDALESLLVRE
ncbi:MAG: sensor hybrid histidine kinase [Armatimonadetes bacterium]|jgi:CheY-like chemotaxis protein|nr:sensor hybrid histidine kinase [Armatimonadota bacterium]